MVEMTFSVPVRDILIRMLIIDPVLAATEYIGNIDNYRVVTETGMVNPSLNWCLYLSLIRTGH